MFDLDRWQEIYSALKKNKMRTFLTAFGVFWGIFMLVVMLGAGNGLRNGVTGDFGDFATNSVFMWTQNTTIPYKGLPRGRNYNFKADDIEALRKEIPEIEIISPRTQGGGLQNGNNVIRGSKSGAFSVMGDYPEWNEIDPVTITSGRFLNNADLKEKRKVAVIGSKVVEILFLPGENPIGQYIQIQGIYFQVIGTFKAKNGINFGGDKEQSIFMPLTTFQRVYNWGDIIGWFAFTSKVGVPASIVEEKASALLRRRHLVSPDDAMAIGSFNLQKEFNQMTGLFSGINGLIWVVGIGTLIAGVIGISNIMLVIVKERTKEIGIQRAIGAPPSKIISQIITESVFLTTFAGYVGLVISVALLELLNKALLTGETAERTMFKNPGIDFNMAIIALAILIISGAVAGLVPARKAVSIKPIDALRYE